MIRRSWRGALPLAAATFATLLAPRIAESQRSLAPASPRGQNVSPVYEGWYKNPDGSFSLSFGYYNRNTEEVVEVPVGKDNAISPGAPDQGQPATFHPHRHWGVFAVRVPADFGKKEVTWTVTFRGATFAIPGSLHPDWQIDALEGEAGGNKPPVLIVPAGGPEARGPLGVVGGPLRAAAGQPFTLSIMASDEIRAPATPAAAGAAGAARTPMVDLAWFKHSGPGSVTFATATARVPATGGTATTAATFSVPGTYVVRIRATDGSVESAGHSQCCWTNAFIRVTVTK